MSTELSKAVYEAITAHLPLQTAGALQEYLATAEATASTLASTQKSLEDLRQKAETFRLENAKLTAQLKELAERQAALEKRELAVTHVEHQLALKDKDVDSARKEANAVERIVGLVFRNTEVQRQVHRKNSTPFMVPSPYPGAPPQAQFLNHDVVETETVTGE